MHPAFDPWFQRVTQHGPRPWQARLAADSSCRSRLIRAPTGTGKTLGVLGAWAYHRLVRRDPAWPRRLVLVLPMRVLAEQCASEIEKALRAMDRFAEAGEAPELERVGVHVLMGGVEQTPWHLYPEHDAVLIGTQDMLLSRALNRGYGAAPGRWPMEYALLHHDALWVLDEVQLMDVGFATSAQLQAFREQLAPKAFRPAHSWWMSATLQPSWFEHTEWRTQISKLDEDAIRVPREERKGGPFDAQKNLRVVEIKRADDPKHAAWAKQVLAAHAEAQVGRYGRITLAICNTVDDATAIYQLVQKALGKAQDCKVELVHSRFRGMERADWSKHFLSRDKCNAEANRIVIATQVVEAGVDISCTALVTQLAPWASLVQRMGRAARYGESASITVVDRALSDDKNALPYALDELNAALEALSLLQGDASLSAIEELEAQLEANNKELLTRLYPYEPIHVLTARDHEDLFDTEPDLTGQDLDVSRFIRSGDERDVLLWWYPLERNEKDAARFKVPPKNLRPTRDELCRVPVGKAREFLLEKAAETGAAFVWDFGTGEYKALRKHDKALVFPGQTFLIDFNLGGYDRTIGFTGSVNTKNAALFSFLPRSDQEITPAADLVGKDESANQADADDSLSRSRLRTIATHCAEAEARAAALCQALALPARASELVALATRLHDIGKAHPAFQASIRDNPAGRNDLAKAESWKWPPYTDKHNPELNRPGLRHELVSTLMLFELLHQLDPYHPALLGPHRELLELLGKVLPEASLARSEHALERELLALDADAFNLTAYLICAHHGKVRVGLRSTPKDQEVAISLNRDAHSSVAPLRGVREGDKTPAITLLRERAQLPLRDLTLHLDLSQLGISNRYGASWTERVSTLRSQYGVHALAYLETILRVADMRASAECDEDDPMLLGGSR